MDIGRYTLLFSDLKSKVIYGYLKAFEGPCSSSILLWPFLVSVIFQADASKNVDFDLKNNRAMI